MLDDHDFPHLDICNCRFCCLQLVDKLESQWQEPQEYDFPGNFLMYIFIG